MGWIKLTPHDQSSPLPQEILDLNAEAEDLDPFSDKNLTKDRRPIGTRKEYEYGE